MARNEAAFSGGYHADVHIEINACTCFRPFCSRASKAEIEAWSEKNGAPLTV